MAIETGLSDVEFRIKKPLNGNGFFKAPFRNFGPGFFPTDTISHFSPIVIGTFLGIGVLFYVFRLVKMGALRPYALGFNKALFHFNSPAKGPGKRSIKVHFTLNNMQHVAAFPLREGLSGLSFK